MSAFSKVWEREVKSLAEACVTEPDLVRLMDQDENYSPSQKEKEYLGEVFRKYKDPYGMCCISHMISTVDRALKNQKLFVAKNAIIAVHEVLKSPSYFQEVFSGEVNNKEWKNILLLKNGLNKILHT